MILALTNAGLVVPANEMQENSCFVLNIGHIQFECPHADIDGMNIERVTKHYDRKNAFHH